MRKQNSNLLRLIFGKNSLLGGVSILGRPLRVKGNCAQDLVFVGGFFSGDSGDFRGRGGEGVFATI